MSIPDAERKLEFVTRGAGAILEKRSFAETARIIFDYCRELTGAQSGYVALLSEDGHENDVLFLEAGDLPCSVDPLLPMPIRGLREIAYRTHRAVYENDFSNSEWLQYLPEGHVVMSNVLFVPLNIDGRTLGIIGLANKPDDFTDEDAEIATVFGELAAIALQNSRQIELLNQKTETLEKALADVKTLRGLLPICAWCKNIRDDQGYWKEIEAYIAEHSSAEFSHSICPACSRKHFPDIHKDEKNTSNDE